MDHHIFLHADKLLDHACLHDEGGRTHFHHNSVDNGERQRNLQTHDTSEARRTLNLQRAADSLNILHHHIHAHAAAGILRYLLICGKSGQRNELIYFFIRISGIRLIIVQNSLLSGLGKNFLPVKPCTVILHADPYLTGLGSGRKRHLPLLCLALCHALFIGLDSVVNGIPYQMHQRV